MSSQPTTEVSEGDIVTLDVDRIAHGGVSIAHFEGRVVFVNDTLPGERVEARITEVKKKFARAETTRVVTASPHRVEHVWAEAGVDRDPSQRAGGAEFGHITLEHQRELKRDVLQDSMRRQGKIDSPIVDNFVVEPLAGDDEANGLGWRTRMRLHVDPETGVVGPYASRSRTVVPVTTLPLMSPVLEPLAPIHEHMPDATTVDLVAPSASDPSMLVTYQGEKRPVGADHTVLEVVAGFEFQVRAGGFWQVHEAAPETLLTAVSSAVDWLGEDVDSSAANLDLYGGVGLLTAGFLDAAGSNARITTVEAVEDATDLAAENLADFPGVQALTGRVERYLADMLKSTPQVRERLARGTVVLDPPRSGAGGQVTSALIELSPRNIIYVACDPVALARDTQTLTAGGYELTALRGFDMFPHTHHFECVAIFQRD